jgi:hypothetical protein
MNRSPGNLELELENAAADRLGAKEGLAPGAAEGDVGE